MKIVKLLRMGALLAAAIAFVGCEMTLNDEDSRKEVVEAKAKANAASGSGSGGGSTGTVEVDQNNVDGTYTAVAKKDWSAGAAGTMDLTSFDTSKGVALSFKIENTTTDQTCVFQADGNIQICAGYVWLSDEMGGGFFEGDNTITENTWEKAIGSHYETVCFNTDGSVDWYLDGVLTFKWTGKSTQVENLFKALKAGVVNILPQTNSTTDVTVSKISYSSALTAAEAKALYDKNGSSSTPAPTTDNSSQGENTGTNNSGNNGNNNSGNTENNNNSGNSGNGQGGESGTGTTVTVENLTSARTFSATETAGYTVKLGCDNSSMKVTSVKYNDSELMPANTAYTLTNLSFNGVNVGSLSADTWTVEYTYSMTAVGSSAWTDYNFEIADGNTTDGALGYWSLRYDNYAVGYLKGYHEYGKWDKDHVDGVASDAPAYGGHWYGMTNNLGELNHSQSLNKTLVMKVQKTADAFVITIKSDGTEVWKCVNEKVSQ